MATPEAHATDEVLRRAFDWKCRLFRNNSGAFKDESGRLIRFGVGNTSAAENKKYKSGDYIGWFPLTITADMVGKTIAVYTELEMKKPSFKIREAYPINCREHAQHNRIKLIRAQKGIAGFARNWQDVDNLIKDFYKGL